MKVLICGGGIGGLSAAIGMAKLGHEVRVFERAPELRSTGAGLNLWPNSGRAIYGLGLKERYDAICVKLDRYLNYNKEGELLYETDCSDWPEKYGAPAIGVYRHNLNKMLAEAVGYENISFGYQVTSVENTDSGVVCHFENGESAEGDVLIGADGIYSTIRDQLAGGVTFRRNDHHAFRWRAIFDIEKADIDRAAQTGFYSEGGWLATIPIGDGLAYWFGSVSGAKNVDEFLAYFQDWTNTHIPSTLALTPKDKIIESPLYDVDGVPYQWTHGRITLLGDAAHPMVPDLAQGASQTFIDAYALYQAFENNTDIEAALAEYESVRRPASEYVVKRSQYGSFMGRNSVDPIPVRYQKEIEPESSH